MSSDERPPVGEDLSGAQEYFDADWYRAAYPDTAGVDPWTHFVRFGDRERRSPGPGFDAAFYAGTYLRLEEGDALRHFLREGRAAGLLPRPRELTAAESREAMARALEGLVDPIVLIGNDAQQAGAPLLLLELARHLSRRGFQPVILLLRAGPLRRAFEAVGPTLILAEGFDLAGLGEALPHGTAVLGSTALSAAALSELGGIGPRVLLIHEMLGFLVSEGLLEEVGRVPTVVAAFASMARELAPLLPAGVQLASIMPGLLHVPVGPQSTARVRERIRAELGDRGPVFLGAGYADERKGFDRFLAMAQAISRREPQSGFVWLGELSGWARHLAERAIDAGLPLMLPGFRSDAAAWYDNIDVYLLVSRQDPGPTTVMDAARRGAPFVALPGDLGLPSLGEMLSGVGTFCASEEEAVEQALAVARSENAAERARRAAQVEQRAGFPRYVDDLLEVLRLAAPAGG